MKFFSKNEFLGIALIFLVVFIVTYQNMIIALARARDTQRRDDLGSISNALNQFQEEFGFFPPSENGKIKACRGENYDEVVARLENLPEFDREVFFEGLRACEWGYDPLPDSQGEREKPYMERLPQDPQANLGLSYLYLSNTNRFQIYSYLEEGEGAEGFNEGIVARTLSCGNEICSFGRSYGETPLDKSIEEYEEELLRMQSGN